MTKKLTLDEIKEIVEKVDPKYVEPGTRVRRRSSGALGTVTSTLPRAEGSNAYVRVDIKWDDPKCTKTGYSTLYVRDIEIL